MYRVGDRVIYMGYNHQSIATIESMDISLGGYIAIKIIDSSQWDKGRIISVIPSSLKLDVQYMRIKKLEDLGI